jgi:hypothetical protein
VVDVGTPAEKEKEAKVASAQADIDRLTVVKSKACEAGATSTATSSPSATASATPSTSTPVACSNWAWQPDPHKDNSWISGGLASIRDAKTPEDAAKAAQEWMGRVQLDRAALQGAIKSLLDREVPFTELGNDNCASDQAKSYIVQMYMELGQATVTPDVAPANGSNSGIASGQVHSSTSGQIHGDRTAIKVVRKNGKVIWIMWRCGNVVTIEILYVPGPTDNNVQVCDSGPDQGKPVGQDGVCAKDPGADPQSNGQVPGQSTKNGPSDDNGNEVGQEPQQPVDSGNGVPAGSQPRSTPSPSPTHGGGPVIPKPTTSPTPLPTPQPTQTASVPPPPPPGTFVPRPRRGRWPG